jgi:hypothetical protein
MTRLMIPLLFAALGFAAEPQVIPLYSGPAPGSESWNWDETTITQQDSLRRVSNVTKPVLMAYLPESNANGTAVVIAPGGGFRWLAIEHEGEMVARYLNSLGVAAFVLK